MRDEEFDKWWVDHPIRDLKVTPDDVRAAWDAAIASEREACAKIVEFGVEHDWPGVGTVNGFGSNPVVAAAIRARGQT